MLPAGPGFGSLWVGCVALTAAASERTRTHTDTYAKMYLIDALASGETQATCSVQAHARSGTHRQHRIAALWYSILCRLCVRTQHTLLLFIYLFIRRHAPRFRRRRINMYASASPRARTGAMINNRCAGWAHKKNTFAMRDYTFRRCTLRYAPSCRVCVCRRACAWIHDEGVAINSETMNSRAEMISAFESTVVFVVVVAE